MRVVAELEGLADIALVRELQQTLVDQNRALRQCAAWRKRHSCRDVARYLVGALEGAAGLRALG